MTPIERALALYRTQAPRRDFWSDLHQHLRRGYVFSTPSLLVLAFPVRSDRLISPISLDDADPDGDTWFVWLAVGALPDILRVIPHRRPYIAFARRGRLRLHEFEKLCHINIS